MNSKLLHETAGQKTFALIFETGDEVLENLLTFAQNKHLTAAHFTGIGAFAEVTLGYFDWQKKDYQEIPLREQVEVVSLLGDVAEDENGRAKLHAHVVLANSQGIARGGHLLNGIVRPTLELVLVESPAHLRRRHDPESGLALIRL